MKNVNASRVKQIKDTLKPIEVEQDVQENLKNTGTKKTVNSNSNENALIKLCNLLKID